MSTNTNPVLNIIEQIINAFQGGYKTTEFWLVLAAGVWNAVYPAYNPNESWKVQAANLAVLAAVAVYTAVRGYVKVNKSRDLVAAGKAQLEAQK